MEIELDRDSEVPVGVQLAWALRARILAGELAPGARLPGVRELAADGGVNVNTVRSVYARLEEDGLISVEHGRGTFVAESSPVDDRLGAVAARALEAAQTAGLDPRDVAAILYARVPATDAVRSAGDTAALAGDPAARAAGAAAARRAGLKAEIAALEAALAAERLRRQARQTEPEAGRFPGARILSEDELAAQRDALAAQLRALTDPPADEAASAPRAAREASHRSSTRPGLVWKPSFGT